MPDVVVEGERHEEHERRDAGRGPAVRRERDGAEDGGEGRHAREVQGRAREHRYGEIGSRSVTPAIGALRSTLERK